MDACARLDVVAYDLPNMDAASPMRQPPAMVDGSSPGAEGVTGPTDSAAVPLGTARGFALLRVLHDEAGSASDLLILQVNSALASLLAADATRLTGARLSEMAGTIVGASADWRSWVGWVALVAAGQDPVRLDQCQVDPDRYLDVVAYPTGEGEMAVLATSAAGAAPSVADASGRRQAPSDVAEERYRTLVEMLPDAVSLAGATDGRILEVNEAASRMYGYSRDELLALRHTDLSSEPEATLQAVRSGVASIPLRLHRRKDGTVFPVEVTSRHFPW